MKIKKACEATNLTERAIRLYLSKGLIAPGQTNGILDFSAEDIQHLRDIAVLRQFDFTIEQIAGMTGNAGEIPEILRTRIADAQSEHDRVSEVSEVLGGLDATKCGSIHALADQIRERRMQSPGLYFSQFDEITEEERQRQCQTASRELSIMEKRTRLRRWLIATVGLVVAVCVVAGVYLGQTRVEGFVRLSPMTVVEVYDRVLMIEDMRATIRTGNEATIEALGRDTITVPYSAYGSPLEADMTLENGCQLTVRLTNLDLLRMGINPLQTMQTLNDDVNDAWMRYVLQTLFAQDYEDQVKLVVREYTGLQPLFREREP